MKYAKRGVPYVFPLLYSLLCSAVKVSKGQCTEKGKGKTWPHPNFPQIEGIGITLSYEGVTVAFRGPWFVLRDYLRFKGVSEK